MFGLAHLRTTRMADVRCLKGETGNLMTEWSHRGENIKFSVCCRCQSCVLYDKLHQFTQWMQNTDRATQKRFLTGILVRCQNLPILENLQRILQFTSGKDFTYARFRAQPKKSEDGIISAWRAEHDTDMMETWEWFKKSPEWTKSKYLLRVLSLCDAHLLHILGNLVHILIAWEKHRFRRFSSTDVCHPAKDSTSLMINCNEPEELDIRRMGIWNPRRKDRDSGLDGSDDPAFTIFPRSSKSRSGVCRHRDFIRRLPVYIAKKILRLLDKASLYSCRCVSRHWHFLSEEILTEMNVKRFGKQAMILEGNSQFKVNPFYAKMCEVPVPISEEDKQYQHGESFPKHKSQHQDFDYIYKGIKTKTIQMEERNVYCGVYNVNVLLEREDPSRVMHYAGGQLVVVGSRDRTVRLLDVASSKEVSPEIKGHAGSVRAVLVCEERDLVISSSYDLSIRCWNLKTGVCTMFFYGHFGTINCLDLCGDRLVSGAKDCRVKVWNLLTRKCINNLKFKHPKPITCVKIDEIVVISSCAGGLVRMWNIENASLMRQINGHRGAVLCLCLDQWHILSGGSDGSVKAWSTNCSFKNSLRTFLHPKEVLTVSFLFLRVITGCMDGKIRIFNFLNGDCLRVIKTNVQQSPILSLHTHHNIVMVNTRDNVLMLEFAEVQWDYSASAVKDWSNQSLSGLQSVDQMSRVGSGSCPKSHHRIRQHARDAQKSTRAATWRKLQVYRQNRAFIDPQFESRSDLSTLRPVSGCRIDLKSKVTCTSPPWSTITSLDKETYDTNSLLLSQSEKSFIERVKKRGPHHPVTIDSILLRVNSSQQGQCSDLARSNMELNARVRDAWGPVSSRETQHKDSASLISKSTTSHPSSRKLPTETTFKKSAKLGAPSTTRNHVDLNPQRLLKSRQTSGCHVLPQLETESTKGSPPKHSQRPLKVACAGINKIAPPSTTSREAESCNGSGTRGYPWVPA
nr:F-box and WD repeat domain containing protein 10B [Misgurnus anguillicaudatus]